MEQRDSEAGVYAINAASEMTGIPVTTLRSWERSFGVVRPARAGGGHRLYSQEDVERLRWLKAKLDDGVQPSVAHRLLEREMGSVGQVVVETERRGAVMIMVAERDPITAELERYFLQSEGYDWRVVLDGRTAVQEAAAMQPDVIILDVILPGVNGLQVCRELKAEPATAAIPVVIFSILDVRERAVAAGADAFLLKPLEQPALVDLISDMLARTTAAGRVDAEDMIAHQVNDEPPATPFAAWLRGTLATLDKDRPADVPCGSCNACCRTFHQIHLRPGEKRARRRLPREYLSVAPGLPPGYLLLGFTETGACPVLIDGRCTIYHDRPLVCRTYDCRMYAATGVEPDRPEIAAQVRRWRFSYPAEEDRELYEAVLAAVRFIREESACLPSEAARRQPIRVATLAVAVHEKFLPGATIGARHRPVRDQDRIHAVADANEELFGDG